MSLRTHVPSRALRQLQVHTYNPFILPSGAVLTYPYPQPTIVRPIAISPTRTYSSSSEPDLKTTLRELIPAKRELLKKVKSHGSKAIGEVKVENTIGGMR